MYEINVKIDKRAKEGLTIEMRRFISTVIPIKRSYHYEYEDAVLRVKGFPFQRDPLHKYQDTVLLAHLITGGLFNQGSKPKFS